LIGIVHLRFSQQPISVDVDGTSQDELVQRRHAESKQPSDAAIGAQLSAIHLAIERRARAAEVLAGISDRQPAALRDDRLRIGWVDVLAVGVGRH
jgi:hypothetical protein